MARKTSGTRGDVRQSALWGSGNRGGEFRTNALWGKGGRGRIVTIVTTLALSFAAGTASAGGSAAAYETPSLCALPQSYVEPGLLERAAQNPTGMLRVIVQSVQNAGHAESSFEYVEDEDERDLVDDEDRAKRAEQKANVLTLKSKRKDDRERARSDRAYAKAQKELLHDLRKRLRGDLDDRFDFIRAVSLEISGRRLVQLARIPGLTITEDVRVRMASAPQIWPAASGILPMLGTPLTPAPKAPAIAFVDSGIDANRADFGNGSRVVAREVVTTLSPNANGDGRGHGTFVASIAAGSAPGWLGASPTSPIVDVDVMNDNGIARTSDVIAGAEWIYQHRESLNIRVANFSLTSARPSNFTKDPLDRAVEKLWFGGVVVVASAGNYGSANGPSGVKFAPANDPFVITVGALDLNGSLNSRSHTVPAWSAYGRTYDGFMKPEVAASGRHMLGAIPASSTLAVAKASNSVAPGHIRLSGTSFAAAVVSGGAAQILARHPDWTPDQVKGALLATTRQVSASDMRRHAAGVGEVNVWKAAGLTNPPNPNRALNRYVRTDTASGVSTFDGACWLQAGRASHSWDAVSWSDVSWTDVSWSDVSWADVSWSDVSWADVSWADVLAVADVSWADSADDDDAAPAGGDYVMTELLERQLSTDADLSLPVEPIVAATPAPIAPVAGSTTTAAPTAPTTTTTTTAPTTATAPITTPAPIATPSPTTTTAPAPPAVPAP